MRGRIRPQRAWSFSEKGLGGTIKARREALRMKQDELATLSGISQSYVSRVERGLVLTPSPDTIVAICRALQISPSGLALVRTQEELPGDDQPLDHPQASVVEQLLGTLVNPELLSQVSVTSSIDCRNGTVSVTITGVFTPTQTKNADSG